jgi:hypothetical protein
MQPAELLRQTDIAILAANMYRHQISDAELESIIKFYKLTPARQDELSQR